jgi:hypothetical protein
MLREKRGTGADLYCKSDTSPGFSLFFVFEPEFFNGSTVPVKKNIKTIFVVV